MKKKYELEDKRKLTEIKKIFKIEKFNKILHIKERGSIFDALEKISKIDISFFDSFHIKMGLVKFFKKISHNLVYEPIIAFYHHDYPNLTNSIELGLLKCVLNKKGDFQYYYINSDWFARGVPQGDVDFENLFNLNETIDNKKLLDIMNTKIKLTSKYSKIIAQEVYLFKKLNWSKEKLKKCIRNSNVVFH